MSADKIQIGAGVLSGISSSTYAMVSGWIHVPDWMYALTMAFLAGIAGAMGAYLFKQIIVAIKRIAKKLIEALRQTKNS